MSCGTPPFGAGDPRLWVPDEAWLFWYTLARPGRGGGIGQPLDRMLFNLIFSQVSSSVFSSSSGSRHRTVNSTPSPIKSPKGARRTRLRAIPTSARRLPSTCAGSTSPASPGSTSFLKFAVLFYHVVLIARFLSICEL